MNFNTSKGFVICFKGTQMDINNYVSKLWAAIWTELGMFSLPAILV